MTPEDEAFEDIERRQGGGFKAKQAMAANKLHEPVAWITPDGEGFRIRFSAPTNDVPLGWDALYSAPPKREWAGLTDEEIERIKLMTYEKETNADGEEQEAVNIDWLIKTAEHFCKEKNT